MKPARMLAHLCLWVTTSVVGAQPAPVKATLVRSIGCDTSCGAAEFSVVHDLIVRNDGELIVVDATAPMLRRFGGDGRILSSSGAKGSGPGEFDFPMRAALAPGGMLQIVDMRLRRLTRMSESWSVLQTLALGSFVAGAAARGNGGLYVLTDDFRGTLTVQEWRPGSDQPAVVVKVPTRRDGIVRLPSIAVSPQGEVILAGDVNEYRLMRYSPNGDSLGVILRDVARVRRTPDEMEDLQRRIEAGRAAGQRAAERVARERPAGQPPPSRPLMSGSQDISLKPHFVVDGLRFDHQGRLWILTGRAPPGGAEFDIFAPNGTFMGSLKLGANVTRYALGGDHLATAGENEDGVPVVRLWRLTWS